MATRKQKATTEFKIEKGVPLPKNKQGRKRNDWPFKNMEVGDSFFVSAESYKTIEGCRTSVMSATRSYRHMKFTSATYREKNGVRVWRIE